MLNEEDRRILRYLQEDPTLSQSELAERARLSPSMVARRLTRMEERGIITGTVAVIDWQALGYAVEVSLRFTLDKTLPRAFDEFLTAARAVPEVLEIQTFLGRVDIRLHVIARDMAQYQQLYRSHILTLPHIADIEGLMQVAAIKDAEELPL